MGGKGKGSKGKADIPRQHDPATVVAANSCSGSSSSSVLGLHQQPMVPLLPLSIEEAEMSTYRLGNGLPPDAATEVLTPTNIPLPSMAVHEKHRQHQTLLPRLPAAAVQARGGGKEARGECKSSRNSSSSNASRPQHSLSLQAPQSSMTSSHQLDQEKQPALGPPQPATTTSAQPPPLPCRQVGVKRPRNPQPPPPPPSSYQLHNSSPLPILPMPTTNIFSPTLSASAVAPIPARPIPGTMAITVPGVSPSYFLQQTTASVADCRNVHPSILDQTQRWERQQPQQQKPQQHDVQQVEHKAIAILARSTGAVLPPPLASASPENESGNSSPHLPPSTHAFPSSLISSTSSCTTIGTTMDSGRSSALSNFGGSSNTNCSINSSSIKDIPSHTTTFTISSTSMMLDRYPPPWDLVTVLHAAPGLRCYDHCRMAAIIYGETAQCMVTTRQLQYGKTLAILRTWDLYSYRHGFEITCGASEMITRILAILRVQANENGATVSSSSNSNSSSTGSMLGLEFPVERNEELLTMDREKALNPANMPPYVARLRDGGGGDLAVAGFVYCSGEFRLWTCDSFASKFFSAGAANKRFEEMRILPSYLFGPIFSPNDRPIFYRNLMEYLLKPTDETKEMNMIAETMQRDGRLHRSFVRARYMVLNEGQYACFALSILPIPGMPSRYGMTASFAPLPTSSSSSSISPLASTNGIVASPSAAF